MGAISELPLKILLVGDGYTDIPLIPIRPLYVSCSGCLLITEFYAPKLKLLRVLLISYCAGVIPLASFLLVASCSSEYSFYK